MRFPELRVILSSSGVVRRVEWDPCREGQPAFDMTGMNVAVVEKTITAGGVPTATITIWARLVEIEENDEPSVS